MPESKQLTEHRIMKTPQVLAKGTLTIIVLLFSTLICMADFRPPGNYPINPSPAAIIKGNFDREGNLDLATVTALSSPGLITRSGRREIAIPE